MFFHFLKFLDFKICNYLNIFISGCVDHMSHLLVNPVTKERTAKFPWTILAFISATIPKAYWLKLSNWFFNGVWKPKNSLIWNPTGPSMSFYPDFIQILSRFYPDFIQILSKFNLDIILVISWFFRNSLYPNPPWFYLNSFG